MSLGYLVVGVNEFYTSKKCPRCTNFVGQATIRRLYCKTCRMYLHRDVMAAENICKIVQGYVRGHGRPLSLQPRNSDGTYPWLETRSSANIGSIVLSSTSKSGRSTKRPIKPVVTSRKRVAEDIEEFTGIVSKKLRL